MAASGNHRTFGLFSTLVEMDEDADAVLAKIDVEGVGETTGVFADDIGVSESSDGNHWATILLVVFSLLTVTINLLLLLLFTRRRSLRTVSNRFVINLLFISLLSSIILVPFVILDIELGQQVLDYDNKITNFTSNNISTLPTWWTSDKLFQSIPSTLGQFTLNFLCTASILSILLIGIDQYLAVLHPLRCNSYMNKPKSLLLIITSYCVSLTSAILVALMNGNQAFFPNIWIHQQNGGNVTQLTNIPTETLLTPWLFGYGVFYLGVFLVTPFITICVIYVLIYRAAHRNSERLRRSNYETPKPTLPKVQSAPNFMSSRSQLEQMDPLVQTPKEICVDLTKITKIERTHSDRIPNIITSLKTKISNASASAFRYREENRTAKISIMVIFMVLGCYAPYGVMYLLNSTFSFKRPNYQYLVPNRISLILLISSNLWSPILFALRNRRVQRELKKFLLGRFKHPYGITDNNRRPSQIRPQIIIQDIETTLNKDCIVQIEPFLPTSTLDRDKLDRDKLERLERLERLDSLDPRESKSILKRVCSKNWGSYKKCSFINVPDGCLDARGSFSSASTQISTEE